MAGRDEMDSTSMDVEIPCLASLEAGDLKGMRLGLPREYFVQGLDKEIEQSVRDAVGRCAGLGADVVEVSL